MNDEQHVYLLRADVVETATGKSASEEMLDKLVRRRLKRLERTLSSHAGFLLQQLPRGLLASFASAEAAVHGACDMQRCCAAIPQFPGTRIGIRIGIEAGPVDQSDAPTALSASRLASCGGMDDVVVSEIVAEALTPALRQKVSPLTGAPPEIAALSFDWRGAATPPAPPPQAAPRPGKTPPRPPRMILRRGGEELNLRSNRRVITIGRDPVNDITVPNPKASRNHCRIIIQQDSFVLVDLSMNGSYIMSDQGSPLLVKHKMVTLAGSGWIALGHVAPRENEMVIEFEIRDGGP